MERVSDISRGGALWLQKESAQSAAKDFRSPSESVFYMLTEDQNKDSGLAAPSYSSQLNKSRS
jgi:hypothetical protein